MVVVTTSTSERHRLLLALPSPVRKSVLLPLVGYVILEFFFPFECCGVNSILLFLDWSVAWYCQGQGGISVALAVRLSPVRFLPSTTRSTFSGPKILYAMFYVYMMTMLCCNECCDFPAYNYCLRETLGVSAS